MGSVDPAAHINLQRATVLLIEDNPQGMDILVQILVGFGVKQFHKCATVAEARAIVAKTPMDLMIVDGLLEGEDGFQFTHWLRRSELQPNRFAPLIVVTGHTQQSKVELARDCGANFVVAKPLTPTVLYERIMWVSREQRPFVDAEPYVGPDRRHKFDGPPAGTTGRRREDQVGELASVSGPNMSQAEIDDLMQPKKVAL